MARPTFGSALSKASCPPRTARSPCGMVKGVVPVRPSPARFGGTTFKGWIRATLYGLAGVEQCDLINVVRVRRRLPALQSSNRSPDARGDGMEQRLNMADRLHAGKYSFLLPGGHGLDLSPYRDQWQAGRTRLGFAIWAWRNDRPCKLLKRSRANDLWPDNLYRSRAVLRTGLT